MVKFIYTLFFLATISFTTLSTPPKVLVFFSITCPMCAKYTLVLKNLKKELEKEQIKIELVFPQSDLSTKQAKSFLNKYKLDFDFVLDGKKEITKKYGATITPECFLVDSNNNVIYSGRIDNWYQNIVTRRAIVTQNYLKNAISNYCQGKAVEIKKTQPIGCYIQ
jgi:peroxiredoxin